MNSLKSLLPMVLDSFTTLISPRSLILRPPNYRSKTFITVPRVCLRSCFASIVMSAL